MDGKRRNAEAGSSRKPEKPKKNRKRQKEKKPQQSRNRQNRLWKRKTDRKKLRDGNAISEGTVKVEYAVTDTEEKPSWTDDFWNGRK